MRQLGGAPVSADAARLNPLITHEFRMKRAVDAADTQIIANKLPKGTYAGEKWIALVDPATPTHTEIRKAETLTAGNIVGFTTALAYAHAEGDPVVWMEFPTANVNLFGPVFTTALQAALAQVSGDLVTVVVPDGSYSLSTQIALLDGTYLMAANRGATITMAAGAGFNAALIQGKSNVTIDGIRLDGNKANVTGNASGIQLHSSSSVTIRNSSINNFTNCGIIGSNTLSNIRIENCRLTDNGLYGEGTSIKGIFLYGSMDNIHILDNIIDNGELDDTYGIQISTGGVANVYNVFIKNNRVLDNDRIGIYLSGDGTYFIDRATVEGNISTGNRDNILMAYCRYSACVGNVAYASNDDMDGVGGDGIVIQDSDFVTISGNNAAHNHARGILLQDSNRCTVVGNTVYRNNEGAAATVAGISIYRTAAGKTANYNLIEGNISADTATAQQIYGIDEVGTGGDNPDHNMIIGNVVVGNATAGVVKLGANTIVRQNQGHATEASGSAVMLSANTSVTVTHGLNITPAINDIIVGFGGNGGSMTKLWVSNITSTQFDINADAAPGANRTVIWQAHVL